MNVHKGKGIVGGLVLGLVSLACTSVVAGASNPYARQPNTVPIAAGTSRYVCSAAVQQGHAMCLSQRRTDSAASEKTPNPSNGVSPTATSSSTLGDSGAYSPAYLESAYDAPSSTSGTGQTVAIVDAYDDPNAASDLSYYRSFFGLSSCTTTNGCFRKVNETGGSKLPTSNSGWSQEISLDLDMVSAICPNCHILLVEANSSSFTDLGTAVNEAVKLGANVVSNSYGGSEFSGEASTNAEYYNHPGVAITVAAGDSGYGVEFPASSNTVTAVGGTTLQQATDTGTRDAVETTWSGSGSGCSAYESKPAWQTDTGCANRTNNDVSAIADPNTGVWVYDSFDASSGSWGVFGGTSVATPIVGSMYALANNGASSTSMNSLPYKDKTALNDVTSGSNGSCSVTELCNAGVGYDAPTGLGTPNGIGAFSLSSVSSSTAPGAPTGLTATAGTGVINLSWTAPSNGGSAITGYNIYRGTTSSGETLLASAGTGTTYADSSVTNGTPYFYEVTAVNAIGEGARSSETTATPVAPATDPSAPTSLVATSGTGVINLSWTAPSNGGSAITGYNIYRGGSSGTETLLTRVGTGTTYADSSVTNGTPYFYEVTAVNGVGEGARSNEATATPQVVITAPSAPTSLAATSGNAVVNLSWTAPSNNGGSAITGYDIYRSTLSGGETLYASVGTGTTYADSSVSNGTPYYYEVAAVNGIGAGAKSNQASATLTAPATVPGAPQNLSGRASRSSFTLNWSAPSNNGGSAITGYAIYRSTTSGAEVLIATVGTSTTYQDGIPPFGRTYYYEVAAINAVGTGPRSNQAAT